MAKQLWWHVYNKEQNTVTSGPVLLGDITPEDCANARLIAAAPDLLAALREIETWLLHTDEPAVQSALRLARAAIAKAEKG